MDALYDAVADITPEKEDWRIKVQIVRLWLVPSFNGSKLPFSLELVFMDEQGNKISASVRRTLIYKFQPRLEEGKVCLVSYFGVGSNGGDYRSTKHDYKLNFQFQTDVQTLAQTDLNISPYSFVSFGDILFTDYNQCYLVDVIGILTGHGTERELEKDGKKTKMNVIELENDGLKIECALFGSYVDELNGHLALGGGVNSVVVVQFAKVKTFKGKVGLQNVMHSTKLIFNPNIEEAESFRQRISEISQSGSQVLSQLSDSPKVSIEDDFLKLTARKTIEELKDCSENCLSIVLATIKHLHQGEGWWYMACKCNKAVIEDSDRFFCEICNRHVDDVFPRYRIKVRVIDETDSASFVLFDIDATLLLNKRCSDMIDPKQKRPHSSYPFPSEILGLVNKTYLFKVEVKNVVSSRFQLSYRVKKVTDDAVLIKKIEDLKPPKVMCSVPEVGALDLMNEFADIPIDKDLKFNSMEITDLGGESQDITPAKRMSDETLDHLEAKSTNVKVIKTIKQEKN